MLLFSLSLSFSLSTVFMEAITFFEKQTMQSHDERTNMRKFSSRSEYIRCSANGMWSVIKVTRNSMTRKKWERGIWGFCWYLSSPASLITAPMHLYFCHVRVRSTKIFKQMSYTIYILREKGGKLDNILETKSVGRGWARYAARWSKSKSGWKKLRRSKDTQDYG